MDGPRINAPRKVNGEAALLSSDGMTASEQRFRALALAAIDRQHAERARLARRLHDEIAQILSGAGLQLDILRMDFEAKAPEIAARTAEIQELLERVVGQVRGLSYELNPDIVERAGLQPALELLAGRFRKLFPGVLRLSYDSRAHVAPQAASAMERIAAEALSNATRHSRCVNIEITVKSTQDGVELLVQDDGSGFDHRQTAALSKGLGLLMMEYSANKAGLVLTIDGTAGKGSTIKVLAPDSSPGAR